jgi:kumamolisin
MESIMPSQPSSIPVRGSERAALPTAHVVGPAASDERLEVTLRVRPRAQLHASASEAQSLRPPGERSYLSREQLASAHGAAPEDIAKVEAFAQSHGLQVVLASAARRCVIVSGTVAALESAFAVKLQQYRFDGGSYRGRVGPVFVSPEIGDVVEGVFGLDDRPQAIAHFKRSAHAVRAEDGAAPHAGGASFTPPQLAKLYNYPGDTDGTGQCIGIVEFGGAIRAADIRAYFKELGLPAPHVNTVLVDHAHMRSDDADAEVMLDIEVAAAIAPKAQIVVYFAPNTSQGFIDAFTHAIHDTVHKPSVISVSWGGPEKDWSAQIKTQLDQVFQDAAALGVTICAASGDAGSSDENPDALASIGLTPDGLSHADFPASSPFALACGGTKLVASASAITSETVWNEDPVRSATGGGISDFFDVPGYQAAANIPVSANPGGRKGRGVPDIAADADPATGYLVRVHGQDAVIGGTSAVAPLMAGLVALLNHKLGHPVGFLNPLLYRTAGITRDITQGNNGAYAAGKGWDACTGLGVPDGAKLLDALM